MSSPEEPIVVESAWIDPLLHHLLDEDVSANYSAAAEARNRRRTIIDNFLRTAPSVALLVLNQSRGSLGIPSSYVRFLLQRRLEDIHVDIRRVELGYTVDGVVTSEEKLILFHDRVRGSLTDLQDPYLNATGDLEALVPLTALTALELRLDANVTSLAPLATLTNLRRIKLEWNRVKKNQVVSLPEDMLGPLASMSGLTSVFLSHPLLSDANFGPLSGLRLKDLVLPRCVVTGSFLGLCPGWRTSLSRVQCGESSLDLRALYGCSNLQTVSFLNLKGKIEASTLVNLPAVKTATHIALDHGLEHLLAPRVPLAVQSLYFSSSDHWSSPLDLGPSLPLLPVLSGLTKLVLTGSYIEDSLADRLHGLSALSRLQEFELNVDAGPPILKHVRAPLRQLFCRRVSCNELFIDTPEPPSFAHTLTALRVYSDEYLRDFSKIPPPTRMPLISHLSALRELAATEQPLNHLQICCPKLRHLYVNTSIPATLHNFHCLTNTARLESLKLTIRVTQDAYEALGSMLVSACPRLETLCINVQVVELEDERKEIKDILMNGGPGDVQCQVTDVRSSIEALPPGWLDLCRLPRITSLEIKAELFESGTGKRKKRVIKAQYRSRADLDAAVAAATASAFSRDSVTRGSLSQWGDP